jgi:hypothetical protein
LSTESRSSDGAPGEQVVEHNRDNRVAITGAGRTGNHGSVAGAATVLGKSKGDHMALTGGASEHPLSVSPGMCEYEHLDHTIARGVGRLGLLGAHNAGSGAIGIGVNRVVMCGAAWRPCNAR